MSSNTVPLSEASPPFNKPSSTPSVDNFLPTADVILRSRDGTDFYLHKAILSSCSQAFAAMLNGTDSVFAVVKDGAMPIIPLEEDAATLDNLFRICYPLPDPDFKDAQMIYNVLEASRKYIIEHASQFCRQALVSLDVLNKDPFSAYTISCYFGLEEEARKAARHSLHHAFEPGESMHPVAIERLGGEAVFSLLKYRAECKSAVQRLINDTDYWLDNVQVNAEDNLLYICSDCAPHRAQHVEEPSDLLVLKLDDSIFHRVTNKVLSKEPCYIPRNDTAWVLTGLVLFEMDSKGWPCLSCREEVLRTVHGFFAGRVFHDIEKSILHVALDWRHAA
ncbi:hypothetical protein OBBRIDRAFT_834150 [Obba rivulosa]|uniref:BTB domain-containing protein n=1 Tax=Obba rivulosa TaxID=1052685 RepID=A0A8E2B3D0_9APHY|nr:hypothetical protein OBBRIDRAFT_834150 [Obba rivulosa]